MNRKGFTLVELLATLVVLGIIVGITIVSVNGIFGSAKNKTQSVFEENIKDVLGAYINMNLRDFEFNNVEECTVNKTHGVVNIYKAKEVISFNDIISDDSKLITAEDMVNPANEDMPCNLDAKVISIYKDEDYIYYYSINKGDMECFVDDEKTEDFNERENIITNLPSGCSIQ